MRGRPVLLTRPERESRELALEIEKLGFSPFVEPLLTILPVDFDPPDPAAVQALVFTSGNAVDRFAAQTAERDFPVFVVGDTTAARAHIYGFPMIRSAAGTIDDLNALLAAQAWTPDRLILHISGMEVAGDVRVPGVPVRRIVAYRAEQNDSLSDECLRILDGDGFASALFFSAHTAQTFINLLEKYGRTSRLCSTKALCISNSVVECLRDQAWEDVQAARTPDKAGLLALLKGTDEDLMSDGNDQEAAMSNAEEIIERFGGIRPMASKMDVPVTTVQGWKKRGAIPENRREDVLNAARLNNIDLSGIAAKDIANENSVLPSATDAALQGQKDAKDRPFALPLRDTATILANIESAEKRAVRISSLISIFLSMLAIAFAAVLLWPTKRDVADHGRRIASLEQDFSKLGSGPDALSGFAPADLRETFETLQEQARTIENAVNQTANQAENIISGILGPDAGNIPVRLSRLESEIEKIQGVKGLTGLADRLKNLQQTPEGQQQLSGSVSDLAALAAAYQGRMTEIDPALRQAQEEPDALGQTLEGVAPADLKAAALLISLTQFRHALGRSEPFADDLAVMQSFLGSGDPELNDSIEKLAPKAAEGVLTPEGLKGELAGLAGEIVAASLQGQDVSVQERARARLNELLQVEKDGELISGTDTQAKIARARKLLDGNDVQGAIAELESLEGEGERQAAAPWIEKARATLSAQRLQQLVSGMIGTRSAAPYTAGSGLSGLVNGLDSALPGGTATYPQSGPSVTPPQPGAY